MPAFDSLDQLNDAVRGILGEAPNINTAKRWIRNLPGPSTVRSGVGGMVTDDLSNIPRGIYFDILNLTVVFNDDGTREATLTVAMSHDDPNPQTIRVSWAQGFLTKAQAAAARKILFG